MPGQRGRRVGPKPNILGPRKVDAHDAHHNTWRISSASWRSAGRMCAPRVGRRIVQCAQLRIGAT